PIHPSTRKVLSDYASRRDRFLGRQPTTFFVSGRGTRLDGAEIRRTFYALSRQIGLRGPSDSHGPRLHDFRHRFAVETLIQWYRSGQEVEKRLPVLATYLGHVHGRHLLVSDRLPRADGPGSQAVRGVLGEAVMNASVTLAALLEKFFTHRLMNQRQAS